MPISLTDLNVDAAFFSAHKIGGPLGVGAFYVRPQVPLRTKQLGGGQEQNKRSGTQNVPAAEAFALAVQHYSPAVITNEAARLSKLRDSLLTTLLAGSGRMSATVPLDTSTATHTNSTDSLRHLPGVLSLLVAGIESETMVLKLDELGFAVSGGSACSTGSLEPSHVLTSLGISKDRAFGALRVSMGHGTTADEVERFATALLSIL